MALNLNLLRSFYLVAQNGSVSGASREGFVSQPALSKAVRELEKQVGLPLLERTSRGVTLTEAGEILHKYARALFSIEREAEDALSSLRHLEGGTLRIGASTTISTYLLPSVLGEFRRLYPGVKLRLLRENTRQIEALLEAYELDVALVEGPPHSSHIVARPWREEHLVCICEAGHPWASREQVWPHELKPCPWVTREEGSGTREVVERVLRPYDLPPADALVIGGAEAVKQAVASGLGIAIVSRESVADQLALGKLKTLNLADVDLRRPFYWLELEGRPESPIVRAFRQLLFASKEN